jgi:hypothetical protein
MMGIREGVKDLTSAFFKRGERFHVLQTRNRATADVVVEVTGREADGDKRTVHTKASVQDHAFDFEGVNGDGECDTAAGRAAQQIVEWIDENRARIVAARKAP